MGVRRLGMNWSKNRSTTAHRQRRDGGGLEGLGDRESLRSPYFIGSSLSRCRPKCCYRVMRRMWQLIGRASPASSVRARRGDIRRLSPGLEARSISICRRVCRQPPIPQAGDRPHAADRGARTGETRLPLSFAVRIEALEDRAQVARRIPGPRALVASGGRRAWPAPVKMGLPVLSNSADTANGLSTACPSSASGTLRVSINWCLGSRVSSTRGARSRGRSRP